MGKRITRWTARKWLNGKAHIYYIRQWLFAQNIIKRGNNLRICTLSVFIKSFIRLDFNIIQSVKRNNTRNISTMPAVIIKAICIWAWTEILITFNYSASKRFVLRVNACIHNCNRNITILFPCWIQIIICYITLNIFCRP